MTTLELWSSRIVEIEPTKLLQAVRAHRPDKGEIGDCFRTAIACLLGLDDPAVLPHFVAQSIVTAGDSWEDLRLARVCLRDHHRADLMAVQLDRAIEWGCAYMLSVHSKTGPWPHCVVARGRRVIHDPSGVGGYRLGDLYDEPVVFVVCEPYEPDPDEMVRLWTAESSSISSEEDAPPTVSSSDDSQLFNEENIA